MTFVRAALWSALCLPISCAGKATDVVTCGGASCLPAGTGGSGTGAGGGDTAADAASEGGAPSSGGRSGSDPGAPDGSASELCLDLGTVSCGRITSIGATLPTTWNPSRAIAVAGGSGFVLEIRTSGARSRAVFVDATGGCAIPVSEEKSEAGVLWTVASAAAGGGHHAAILRCSGSSSCGAELHVDGKLAQALEQPPEPYASRTHLVAVNSEGAVVSVSSPSPPGPTGPPPPDAAVFTYAWFGDPRLPMGTTSDAAGRVLLGFVAVGSAAFATLSRGGISGADGGRVTLVTLGGVLAEADLPSDVSPVAISSDGTRIFVAGSRAGSATWAGVYDAKTLAPIVDATPTLPHPFLFAIANSVDWFVVGTNDPTTGDTVTLLDASLAPVRDVADYPTARNDVASLALSTNDTVLVGVGAGVAVCPAPHFR